MSFVLRKSIFYSYAHNKGTDQTARMRIQIRILVVRCSDILFIGLCMPNSTLRRAAETEQASVVLSRHNNNTLILYCNRNSKHLSRPYKTYLTKLSSQNVEPF